MDIKQEETLHITKQMIEDLYVIAEVYNMPVYEVIRTLTGNEEKCDIEIIA